MIPKEMRIIFMGTPEYSVPTLKVLLNKGYNVIAVITNPDKKSGRGKKIKSSPVKRVALDNGIDIMQPKSLKTEDFFNKLKKYDPDIFITIAYGKIIPENILNMPKYGCINVHASLLPKYRGAAPIWWAVINGEEYTGITTMYSDKGIDTGKILLKEKVKIDENMTTGELHDKMASLSPVVLEKTLEGLAKGKIKPKEQNHKNATYAKKIEKDTGRIDWSKSAKEIKDLIRGTNPWPGAYTYMGDMRIKIFDSHIIENENNDNKPGEIINVKKDYFEVACGSNSLKICKLQIPGCRKMDCCDYLCGHEVKEGTLLT